MMRYEQEKKHIAAYVILIAVISLFSAFLSEKFYQTSGFNGCALDGIFIWAMKPRLLAYVLLPVASYWCLYVFNSDFKPEHVLYYRNRGIIWFRQMGYCLLVSGGTLLIDMLVSFIRAFMETGVISNYRITGSWYSDMMGMPYGTGGEIGNLGLEVLKGYLLNLLEMYIVVATAVLLYWMWNRRVLSMLLVIVVGIGARYSCSIPFSKAGGKDNLYYQQIMNQRCYSFYVLRSMVLLCVVFLIAYFIVCRKEFLTSEEI